MPRAVDRDSILGLRSPRSLALVGAVAALLLASAALPVGKQRRSGLDPTAKANLAYNRLQEQLGDAPAAPGATAVGGGTAPGSGMSGSLQRDLFRPVWRVPVPSPPGTAPAPRSGPPALTGIFIDGPTREAVLAGVRVRVGEYVDGYRVMAIQPDAVRLRKGRAVVRLTWGGNR
jgi:hypothetical protein